MGQDKIMAKIKAHESKIAKVAIVDIDGILRGKIIRKDKLLKSLKSGFNFCDVVFGWDANDAVYNNSPTTGLHTGYPDAFGTIDLNTFREITWENNMPFFLADFSNDPLKDVCPRSLLKKVAQKAADMGFTPMFSIEFEWFNFQETPQSLAEKQYHNPKPLTPGMFGYSMLRLAQNHTFFEELFHHMEDFGVPIEGLHTETGNGVMEAALSYAPVVEAADRGVLFKMGAKAIAYKHQIMASFMAKWNASLPGCSGHIHQSLWDVTQQRNLFAHESGMSDLMKHYLAGQLYALPFLLPMVAPTVNSYKRLAGGDWAPATLTWGFENRTTAWRIINNTPDATRIEGRTSGADVNPYLAMAAYLAAGLYGIEQKIALNTPPVQGNGYKEGTFVRFPLSLKAATQQMKASGLPIQLLGEKFVQHFIATREWEYEQYQKQVSDWELRRYFEII
jgi:glutamine synthetase